MDRTTKAGFLITLWGMCCIFLDPHVVTQGFGFLWFAVGAYLYLKEDK